MLFPFTNQGPLTLSHILYSSIVTNQVHPYIVALVRRCTSSPVTDITMIIVGNFRSVKVKSKYTSFKTDVFVVLKGKGLPLPSVTPTININYKCC